MLARGSHVAMTAGGYEVLEDLVRRSGLGMPLDREDPAVLVLEPFDHSIFGPCRRSQTGTDPVHGLVVVGRDDYFVSDRARKFAAGRGRDVMYREAAHGGVVHVSADHVGEVLSERPTTRDVHELHATADPEYRDIARHGGPQKGAFPLVAGAIERSCFLMWILTEQSRIDVGTTRKNQTVKQRCDVNSLVGVTGDRQQDRNAPRLSHMVCVARHEQERCVLPCAPPGERLHGNGYPDDWP